MSDNRRETFRAEITEGIAATLICGRRRMAVQVAEESAGGLAVIAGEQSWLSIESEVELTTNDGRNMRVLVKHCKPDGSSFRIGLQRVETVKDDIDLRHEFAVPANGVSAAWYAGVLLIGLLIGAALQTETIQHRLMKLPAIKAPFGGK